MKTHQAESETEMESTMEAATTGAQVFEGVNAIEVEVMLGDVTVTSAPGPVRLWLTARSRGGDELLAEYRIEQSGGTLSVRSPKGARGIWSLVTKGLVEVRIEAPSEVELRAKTGMGDIRCIGPRDSVWLTTGSGDVEVEECRGELEAKTGSGDVSVGTAHGLLSCKTGSGDVGVGRVIGPLTASTGSGDVSIGAVAGEAKLKTGSGDITVHASESDVFAMTGMGTVALNCVGGGQNRVKTGSGDVVIAVAQGIAALLDLHTATGDTRIEMEQADGPRDSEPTTELHVHSGSGDITIRRATRGAA